MNPSDHPFAPPGKPPTDEDRLRASRRAAILGGLGKGSAALVAMSPLASHASRSHVLFNPALNQNCYCTVSGFQSAALSPSTGANPPVCAAYLPRTFLVMPVETIPYTVGPLAPPGGANSSLNARIATYLNGRLGITTISANDINQTLRASTPVPLVVTGTNDTNRAVFVPVNGSNASCHFLRPRNFPSGIVGTGTFKSIFANSNDTGSLLQVLFDGVTPVDGGVNASAPNARCLFLAAYLSVDNPGLSEVLPTDLTRAYFVAQYGADADALLTSNAGQFLSKLCSLSA